MIATRRFTSIAPSRLPPRLTVLGYLKVGGVSDLRYSRDGKPYSLPTRYTDPVRFEVTTREKDVRELTGKAGTKYADQKIRVNLGYKRDERIHGVIGKDPSQIDVRLMFDTPEQNLISFLGAHDGTRWICQGDGERATDWQKGEVSCTCPRLKQHEGGGTAPDRTPCKPHGTLSVIVEASETFGGFHQFKTSSWESIANLQTQLKLFHQQFGTLAGLPLTLQVYSATKQFQGADGSGVTTQPIVTLLLRASFDTARQIGAASADQHRQYLLAAGGGPDPELHREAVWKEMEEEAGEVGREFYAARAPVAQGSSPLKSILAGEQPAAPEEAPPEVEGDWEVEDAPESPAETSVDTLKRLAAERADQLTVKAQERMTAAADSGDEERAAAALEWLRKNTDPAVEIDHLPDSARI